MPYLPGNARDWRHALLAALMAAAAMGAPAAEPDIRVLIDTSGSMRQNDPHDLRIPALKLLTELLPRGATAGIWLFDAAVETLAAPRTVDDTWKADARGLSRRVHSRGLFTNIEAALAAASEDWTAGAPAAGPRHIILLTDGMVDVAGDPALSAASHGRIVHELLNRLQAQGARIHTIALSANADHALLEALAGGTEGWSEQVVDAASLQRVFLRMFEQAAAPDTLPIEGNRFNVDDNVRELTLLVFHADGAAPLQLTDPTDVAITQAGPAAGIRWEHEAAYDLVTIVQPASGTWQLNAVEDPDNRVLVVTDLELSVADLPAQVVAGESLPVRAALLERGQPIARRDFLELMESGVRLAGPTDVRADVTLALQAEGGDFIGEAATELAPGDYELIVRVDGGTFQREQHRRLKIHGTPLQMSHEVHEDPGAGRQIRLHLAADPLLVDPGSMSGLVLVSAPGRPQQVMEIPALVDAKASLTIDGTAGGDYVLQPWVFMNTRAARGLRLKPDPLAVSLGGPTAAAAAAPLPAMRPVPDGKSSLMHTAIVVGIGNAGLGSVLGGLWFALRRRGSPDPEVSL